MKFCSDNVAFLHEETAAKCGCEFAGQQLLRCHRLRSRAGCWSHFAQPRKLPQVCGWAVVSPARTPLWWLHLGLIRDEDGSWWILAGPGGSGITSSHHDGPTLGGKGPPWCDRGLSLAADPWRNSAMGVTRDFHQRRKIHVSA